ncbi:MAG TPA: hypothetical protein VHX17_05990 [Candidatus Cybelea sp.]|nr:hypothetical protein [Candidatus Cybelea sp.]
MMPLSNGGGSSGNGVIGNAVVRIFVPTAQLNGPGRPLNALPPQSSSPGNGSTLGGAPGLGTFPTPVPTPPTGTPASPPPPGAQMLAINFAGPTAISQSITVGPNAAGCAPAPGGSSCQISLSIPAGTYVGTIGAANAGTPTAVAFTVAANGPNVFGATTGGVPAAMTIVPASSLSGQSSQGELDLYGAGRHPVLVEALDANQNVIIGGPPATFALNQAGGSLALSVAQAATFAPNLFYVSSAAPPSANGAYLRASATYSGTNNPCLQSNAVCSGTMRIGVRQILAVANSNANDITMYVNGANLPLTTVQNAVSMPQALTFDATGNLFVANLPGSVTVYAPPYGAVSTSIGTGINHPQALAVDSRGDLFVANGSGSNTVTVYSPPYGGSPTATIATGIGDPVSITVDQGSDLFVVNQASNTVTIYQPPYLSAPTVISKGLNAPNSLALDQRGNLFVANLNSTPNSVVEFSPPFTTQSAPVATITSGVNEQGAIGLSGAANLFVPNQGANTVTEYVAPYVAPPATIAGGQSQPVALAIDGLNNLYVANYGNNTITVYPQPYAGGSWTAIGNGISQPLALALSPATNAGAAVLP